MVLSWNPRVFPQRSEGFQQYRPEGAKELTCVILQACRIAKRAGGAGKIRPARRVGRDCLTESLGEGYKETGRLIEGYRGGGAQGGCYRREW